VIYYVILFSQVISLRIASRFGGDPQEIVLHSGTTQDGGAKSQGDATSTAADSNSSTALPGPSNATSISSTLHNVAQIIAAGKFLGYKRNGTYIAN